MLRVLSSLLRTSPAANQRCGSFLGIRSGLLGQLACRNSATGSNLVSAKNPDAHSLRSGGNILHGEVVGEAKGAGSAEEGLWR
jgi:hypothetical protein